MTREEALEAILAILVEWVGERCEDWEDGCYVCEAYEAFDR